MSKGTGSRIIRSVPWYRKTASIPYDTWLWISEKLACIDWDALSEPWSLLLGAALNALLLLARISRYSYKLIITSSLWNSATGNTTISDESVSSWWMDLIDFSWVFTLYTCTLYSIRLTRIISSSWLYSKWHWLVALLLFYFGARPATEHTISWWPTSTYADETLSLLWFNHL